METPTIDQILYVTDLGDTTKPVFAQALNQAKVNDASIIVLHVVEPMDETAHAVIQTYLSEEDVERVHKDGMKKVHAQMKKRIENFLKNEWGGQDLTTGPVSEIVVAEGMPSEEILRVAEEHKVDLIVIGKSSWQVRGHKVMGTTARRVNRLTQIPVLVVPN